MCQKTGFDLIKLNRLWKECGCIVLVSSLMAVVQRVKSKSHNLTVKLSHCWPLFKVHTWKQVAFQFETYSAERNLQHRGLCVVFLSADREGDGVMY